MEVAERKLLAREGDVDDVLRQGALELGALELAPGVWLTACSIATRAAFRAMPVSRSRTSRSASFRSLERPR